MSTPFGLVDVIGTHFHLQVDDQGSRIAVDHGSVQVRAAAGTRPVTVLAGYAVSFDRDKISAPGPVAAFPTTVTKAPARSSAVVHLGVDSFRASDGWEGDLIAGAIRGRPVDGSPVTRITTPLHRPDGIVRLTPDLRCTIDLSVNQPTTLAVLLVCDHPDGGRVWLGNLQTERRIPAGAQQITITLAELSLAAAGTLPPIGSRVVAVAVMSWLPAADVRMQWIEFAP